MKLEIIRLDSAVPFGAGGPSSAKVSFIYGMLMQKYACDYYGFVFIHQIGDDLNEVIIKDGKNIAVNVRFEDADFLSKSVRDQDAIRLEIIHTGMRKLADKEKKLDVATLEKIKSEILEQDFKFDFVLKEILHKKKSIRGQLVMSPTSDRFLFYFVAILEKQLLFRILIYEGKPVPFYIPIIFKTMKWVKGDHFLIKDKANQFNIVIDIQNQRVEFINLTNYVNPPYFEMMKAGTSPEVSRQSYQDWLDTLPPEAAGFLSELN